MSGPVFKMQVNEDGSVTPVYVGTNPHPEDSPGVTFQYPNFTWFFPQYPGEQPPAPKTHQRKRQQAAQYTNPDSQYMTTEEMKQTFRCSYSTLWRRVQSGELPQPIKRGRWLRSQVEEAHRLRKVNDVA